ncbi:MAG: hypothetical protein HY562_12645, partial [Ignavibacteriales bacterium]|nr:hypothetical protein [Ignavibacteriales bacterium]
FFEHELATNNTRKILDGVLLDISRDDQYILYRRDQDTLFWRGVLARKAAPDKIIREIESRWGPPQFTWDSKHVVAHDSARIWFTPVDEKGKPRFYKKPKNFGFVHSLPDGKAILGTIWDASARTSTLVKFTLSNGSVESLVALPPASEIWTWGSSVSPDGKTLLFTRQETKNRLVLLENFR